MDVILEQAAFRSTVKVRKFQNQGEAPNNPLINAVDWRHFDLVEARDYLKRDCNRLAFKPVVS
jgi:hypothetical protein